MSDLNDLEAARALLATIEGGRSALLGFASAHLPFARALAIHRSCAEGGSDLVAAEEAVTLRVELYWQAWRAAARGEGGVAELPPPRSVPAAPPRPRPSREPVRVEPRVYIPDPLPDFFPEPDAADALVPELEPLSPEAFEEVEAPAAASETAAAPEPAPERVTISLEGLTIRPEPAAAPAAPPERETISLAGMTIRPEAPAPDAPAPPAVMVPSGSRPVDGQVGVAAAVEPGPVRIIDPVTESPLLEELLRQGVRPDLGRTPFEPISELDYVEDDASEVTQVAKVVLPPLGSVGAPQPGDLRGSPIPVRPKPELMVDDFNEISELEELEPGEFGVPGDRGHLDFPPAPRPEPVGLPITARRSDDDEVLAQGDAPILPEFNAGNSDDLSLSFEAGAGLLKGAPRLTDEEEAKPAAVPAPRRDTAGDQAKIQKALSEAENAVSRGDLARAIQHYSDALDIGPGNVEAHIGRGRAHLELGDYSSAMSDFQRAEDLSPNDPESHLAMGDLYYNRKEYKRAIDFYDEAVELDGQHAMAKCKRGLAHYYRKNYKQAFTDLQRAMALDPNIPNIHKYVQMAMKKMDGKG